MIYILTGAIRTGKTTALLNWVKTRNDVDGLLCPDGENGKRYFLKLKLQDKFPLETDSKANDVISVGDFYFLKVAFETANRYLKTSAEDANKYLVIDELGKLELKNQGLHHSAETIIPKFKFNKQQHLILVVRDYLLTKIMEHYSLSNYAIINIKDLNALH